MQNSIAILSSDAPLEEKVLAVKTLEKFKNDIITFVDEPLNAVSYTHLTLPTICSV